MNTLELECGVELGLQPVKSMILLDFVDGGPSKMTQAQFNKMIKYIAGWGVVTDPPEEESAELAFMGEGKHLQRSAWVRMIATDAEIAQLMAQVMALTKINTEQQQTPEQAEIDELRAKVERLEGVPQESKQDALDILSIEAKRLEE